MSRIYYNRIKVALVKTNHTNKELAQALNRTEPTVSKWCTNDVQPPIETLYKIADFLKVDVRSLLTENTQNIKG